MASSTTGFFEECVYYIGRGQCILRHHWRQGFFKAWGGGLPNLGVLQPLPHWEDPLLGVSKNQCFAPRKKRPKKMIKTPPTKLLGLPPGVQTVKKGELGVRTPPSHQRPIQRIPPWPLRGTHLLPLGGPQPVHVLARHQHDVLRRRLLRVPLGAPGGGLRGRGSGGMGAGQSRGGSGATGEMAGNCGNCSNLLKLAGTLRITTW